MKILPKNKNQKQVESDIQIEIILWFRKTYKNYLIFSVPNDFLDMKRIAKAKKMGVVSGIPDLIVVLPNKNLYIELKTESGVLSPNQKLIRATLLSLGHEYYLIRSLDEFKILLKSKEG